MPITTTPSSGPQGEFSTYTPIYSTTITSAVSSVTLSNIPIAYTDLVLSVEIQAATSGEDVYARFNSDTGSNYSSTWLRGISSTATSLRQASTGIRLSDGGSSTTGNTTVQTINIQNYSNATTFKTVVSRAGSAARGLDLFGNLWRSTSPITSITFYMSAGNISSGTITVYGIKAATPAPKASGGDAIVTDGTYWYHAFKYSGIFQPVSAPITCDYLVVAGGGAGGSRRGGGGGAGGVRAITSQTVTNGTVVTVGAGGVGSLFFANDAYPGNNSSFGSYSTTGGGAGGGDSTRNRGGSGGGNRGSNGSGTGNLGGYSPVEGYAGANNSNAPGDAGGGGGAGGAGSVSAGGVGTYTYNSINFSTWLSYTSTGASGYVGGGGGGGVNSGSGGSGGAGGGGAGISNYSSGGSSGYGVAGTANTGGGGGGGGNDYRGGGAGGSGLVIVRYAV